MSALILLLHLHLVTMATVINVVAAVPVVTDEVFGTAQVHESVIRSLTPDPKTIDVKITAFGETRNLRLIPNVSDVFATTVDGYISDLDDNGNLIFQRVKASRSAQADIHAKLYTDSTGSASLYVERREGHIALEGILDHNTRIESRQGRSTQYNPVDHVVYKRSTETKATCHTMVPDIRGSTSTEEHKVEARQLPALVQPEVLLVLDYLTSKYHNFNLDAAKKYLAIYFNSVNRRYSDISSPKIQNVITGIVFTKSETDQSFVVYGSKPILDAGKTLNEFGKWIRKQNTITTNYDIVLWMTALELGVMTSDGKWTKQNVGVAYVGGACTKNAAITYSVALGEDTPGSYKGIHTHAHEMAHLYGSAHDGEIVDNPRGNPGALTCPKTDGYIMSYEFGSKNRFYFSSCSVNQMKFTLGSTSASCLIDTPKPSVVASDSTLPGAIKSLDNQCVDKHGSGYKFYEGRLNEVCVRMWCQPTVSSGNFISLATQGPALEGSRCGSEKICIKGECKNK